MGRRFIQIGTLLVAQGDVRAIDVARLAEGSITLTLMDGRRLPVIGIQAFDAVLALQPAALEGVRLSFGWNAWVLHNLVAHPLMQVLALCRLPKAALWVHDRTVPKPRGVRKPKPAQANDDEDADERDALA